MDKFLDIICANQIMSTKEQGDKYIEFFEPFMSKLKDIVSEKVYSELEEMFSSCVVENNSFYAAAVMKIAIVVIDDTYVPTVKSKNCVSHCGHMLPLRNRFCLEQMIRFCRR